MQPDCTCGHMYGEHRIDLIHKACGHMDGAYDQPGQGKLILCRCLDYTPVA